MSILKGPEGGFSSKRAVGLGYAALGIVMVVHGQFTDHVTDFDILLLVLGMSLTALGISSAAYFANPKIVKPRADDTVDPTKPGGPKT